MLKRQEQTRPVWPQREPSQLRRSDDQKIYDHYCDYCKKIGSRPLPIEQWLTASKR